MNTAPREKETPGQGGASEPDDRLVLAQQAPAGPGGSRGGSRGPAGHTTDPLTGPQGLDGHWPGSPEQIQLPL